MDTAEIYGSGYSERLSGKFLKETSQPVLTATKVFPWPWRLTSGFLPRRFESQFGTAWLGRGGLVSNSLAVAVSQRGDDDGRLGRVR